MISQLLLAEMAPPWTGCRFSTTGSLIATPEPPEMPAPATESSSFRPLGSSTK
jgi:hypothetical protein